MNTSLLSLYSFRISLGAFLNLLHSDPFNITYPTAVQASLPSQCCLARFDRSGRFVAAGRSDGSAAIWDLETRAAVRWLEGHVKGITSVECVMCTSPSGVL
jgi:COMPASS component SWD1